MEHQLKMGHDLERSGAATPVNEKNGLTTPTKEAVRPVEDFPEGGTQAWLTILGGFMVSFCTFGSIQSFGVFQDYYTRVSLTTESTSTISWIGSTQSAFLFFMGLFSGRLFDNGYFRHVMMGGSLIYLFSVFMLSLAKPENFYQNYLSQGLGMGIGMGLMFNPAISVPSHYFKKKRAYAMGLVFTGAAVGGVIYPIMLNKLFNGSAGFAWGVRAMGFLDLFLLSLANVLMKTRLPSRKEIGGQAPGFRNLCEKKDIGYWICIAGSFFVIWGVFIPYFYLQLYSNLHGVSKSIAIYAISIMNATSLIGRLIPPFLADKWGAHNVIIPVCVFFGVFVWALYACTNVAGMVIFAVFYGATTGGYIAVVSPMMASWATDRSEIGTRIGVFMLLNGFALLTGNPIAGALVAPPQYIWWRPLLFASVVILFGCVLLMVARQLMVHRKGTQLV